MKTSKQVKEAEASDIRVSDSNKPVKIFHDENDPTNQHGYMTVPELMQQVVDKYPNRNALMYRNEGNDEWNGIKFTEYRDRVGKIAKVFIKLGLERRGTVAVLAFNSVEWFISEFAAIHAK